MEKKESKISVSVISMAVVIALIILMAFLTNADSVQQTAWSLVPPVIAIALALITKEVYSSLFIGIITGALLYSGYNFEGTLTHIFNDGVIAVLSDSYNMGILVFLVILGIMVQLMNRTGGSAAFGNCASEEKVQRMDQGVLAACGLSCAQTGSWRTLAPSAREMIFFLTSQQWQPNAPSSPLESSISTADTSRNSRLLNSNADSRRFVLINF